MKIWIARHGQTDLNKKKLMQGRTDAPLNEKGIEQARRSRQNIGDVRFDAVYSSPLQRAKLTGAIIGGVDISEVIEDPRIIETDFGRYEKRRYYALGLPMTAYWTMPRIFPAPPTVESIESMKERASSFLKELETHDYDNVLVACHGGSCALFCGYLDEDVGRTSLGAGKKLRDPRLPSTKTGTTLFEIIQSGALRAVLPAVSFLDQCYAGWDSRVTDPG